MKNCMMSKKHASIGILLIVALLLTVALPETSQAADKGRKNRKKSESVATAPKLSPYEKLFKDKTHKSVDGLFKLHLVDGKIYTEIPLALLNREFVIHTTIEESSMADYGLAGQQPIPPYHVAFSLRDSTVCMHEVPQRVLAESGSTIEQALKINSLRPIVASYPVKAYNADSTTVVIENTDLFMSDNEHLMAFEAHGMTPLHVSRASYKSNLSLLRDIGGGEGYSSVVSDLTYYVTTQYFIFTIRKDVPFTALARRTITMLPERTAPARIADPRIGVVPVPYTRFSVRQGSRPAYFASRINFRKEGEIRPVTFYVDTLFSPLWREGIRRGVELWNEAFRRIGMGDVLQTADYPASGFDADSPGTFCVKYVASTNPKVTVNVVTDPRSGEITGGRIHLSESLRDEIRNRRFLDLAAVDPRAREMRIDDGELVSSLAVYTARGVAQILGLATNYAGASAYPTDSLRSASFTREWGLCSSITALNSYNYLAQPEDKGVRLVNDCLGKYDYFAIAWLYGEISGAETPEEERPYLSEMLRSHAADPAFYYGNFWYDYYFGDVRLAYTNLGDDPVKRCEYRLRNLRETVLHAEEWLADQDFDGSYRREAIDAIATGVREVISYLAAYIGGAYYTEVGAGDGQTQLRVVPKEDQQRYVRETLRFIEDLSWLDTPLTKHEAVNLSQSLRDDCLMTLFKRLETLTRYQTALPGAYTPEEMTSDLTELVFRKVKTGKSLSEYDRLLQQSFVGVVIGKSNVLAEPKPAKTSSQAFADAGFGEMAPAFPREASAILEMLKAYNKYRMTYYARDFSDHIYYDLLLEMREIYRRGMTVARDADSQAFCRYMFRRIDESLKI